MSLKDIGLKALRTTKVFLGKYGPDIMVVGGAGLVVGGAVYACFQTYNNLDNALDTIKERTETEEKSVKTTVKNIGSIAKVYAAPAAMVLGGTTLLCGGYGIMKKGRAAAIATANSLNAAYQAYREEIRARYGSDVDHEIAHKDDPDYILDVDEKGQATKKTALTSANPYSMLFCDYTSKMYRVDPWTGMPDHYHNYECIIRNALRTANDQLNRDGYLFVNDVRKMLGMDGIFPEGNQVGWVKDGYKTVSFGVENLHDKHVADFREGREPNLWLELNVDGYILDKIDISAGTDCVENFLAYRRTPVCGAN